MIVSGAAVLSAFGRLDEQNSQLPLAQRHEGVDECATDGIGRRVAECATEELGHVIGPLLELVAVGCGDAKQIVPSALVPIRDARHLLDQFRR